ncbi:hypothetical protein TIFTF001_028831 [Ficus carica]|uniref:Uncharacterized protein n=1 Tax=Ficus carica TaxID=3494 RepID=A0AA88DQP1_FICCA|nr:hypothetical protein TIFTF001_028831 [Ficus carica]
MVIGLAKLYEGHDNSHKRPSVPGFRQAPTTQGRKTPPTTTVERMTPDELTERRKKGLCFHCNNKYSPGHDCPKLFRIEACSDDNGDVKMEIEEDTNELAPEISLHAMAGMNAPKTMQLWGGLMGQPVMILVDSGSTHNFISSLVAQPVNLLPSNDGGL